MIAKEQRVKEARRTDKRAVVGILAFMASAFGYGFDKPATVELRLGNADWKPSAEHPRGRRHDGGPSSGTPCRVSTSASRRQRYVRGLAWRSGSGRPSRQQWLALAARCLFWKKSA